MEKGCLHGRYKCNQDEGMCFEVREGLANLIENTDGRKEISEEVKKLCKKCQETINIMVS